MAPTELPTQLQNLLTGTRLAAPIAELADSVGVLLTDNQMPFFPAYTDHGPEHVEQVLAAGVRLVPDAAWVNGLIQPADAAVMACATMLHDLAMHMREHGFLHLISPDCEYRPLSWFADAQGSRSPDLPWPELWADFQREARHFGKSQLDLILGPPNLGVPALAHDDRIDPTQWTGSDRLLVGEFLRRHHARLAHEIAIYGFPGATSKEFPVLSETLADLGDLAGAVARSHNESLRQMLEYLQYLAPGAKRPMGVLAPYLMALLRVADYLQLEADRAPTLLLRLKAPQSPLSVEEWNKHGAISSISWDNDDPLALFVTVSQKHGLRTHLALGELLAGLQREMDQTAAILGQTYNTKDLAPLHLTRQRVLSNLAEPSLHDHLPYLPRRAALRSDPDLFRLVVRDLYGDQPAVAGRELVQNAVDAVRARRRLEERTGEAMPGARDDLDADVVVTVKEGEDGGWLFTVADSGLGMTPNLVVDYFLQAGASFGPTPSEIADLKPKQAIAAMKAGRFGVGAFAAFLLGREMRVTTRHVGEKRGVSFRASIDEDLVQLDWTDAPVGTEIEIPFAAREGQPNWPQELLQSVAIFYRLRDPKVSFRLVREGEESPTSAPGDVPPPKRRLPDDWRSVNFPGMDSVLWRVAANSSPLWPVERRGQFIHNGILIQDPERLPRSEGGVYGWSDRRVGPLLRRPKVAVFDSRHLVEVALHRYSLVDPALPFEKQLLESIGTDIVAHALVAGSKNHPLQEYQQDSPVFSRTTWLPLLPAPISKYVGGTLLVLWHLDDRWTGISDPYRDIRSNPPELIGVFIGSRSKLPWGDFPHRVHAALRHTARDPDDAADMLRRVSRSAEEFARNLGVPHLATAVTYEGEIRSHHKRERTPIERFSLPSESAEHMEEDGLREVEHLLIKALATLLASLPYESGTFGLTVHGEAFDSTLDTDALTTPWIEMVGGPMPRAKKRIHAEAERLASSHRALPPLIKKWQRQLG
jgi:Histidine kinase-, DNA gyrase B-, and HSP90-like ATPase